VRPENATKLREIFGAVLNLPEGFAVSDMRQDGLPSWDSLAHVTLIAAMESEFGISIDAGDTLGITSHDAAARFLEGLAL